VWLRGAPDQDVTELRSGAVRMDRTTGCATRASSAPTWGGWVALGDLVVDAWVATVERSPQLKQTAGQGVVAKGSPNAARSAFDSGVPGDSGRTNNNDAGVDGEVLRPREWVSPCHAR
jgi:hypothetical protein